MRGWVARRHTVGGLVFALVRDGTGYLQVSVKKGSLPEKDFEAAKGATRVCAVIARGSV